jgi:hypothetical protein
MDKSGAAELAIGVSDGSVVVMCLKSTAIAYQSNREKIRATYSAMKVRRTFRVMCVLI